MSASQTEEYLLSPLNSRQAAAMQVLAAAEPNTLTILGFGGAVGGGKSFYIARSILSLAMAYPGGRFLVARQEFNKLKTTTMEEFERVCPPSMIVRRNNTDNWMDLRLAHWPEGIHTRIYWRGMENWTGLMGEQYSAIFIDEAGETARVAAAALLTRLRHPLPRRVVEAFKKKDPNWGMRYFFVAASNPWPGWFTDWFILKRLDDALEATNGVASVHFVQSKISDNIENLPPNYEAIASVGLPPDMAKRFIEGRFDSYADQVYGEAFDPNIHRWVGKEPEKSDYNRVIGGLDFGGARNDAHFSSGIVAIVTNSNRLIRVAEFRDNGPGILERQMAWMIAQQGRWGIPGQQIHWSADKTQSTGIQALRLMGFRISPTKGENIEEGINRVMARLALDKTGIPGSFYLPELKMWEQEMYEYRWDKSDDENKPAKRYPIKRGDDLADSDRYLHELTEQYMGKPEEMLRSLPSVA